MRRKQLIVARVVWIFSLLALIATSEARSPGEHNYTDYNRVTCEVDGVPCEPFRVLGMDNPEEIRPDKILTLYAPQLAAGFKELPLPDKMVPTDEYLDEMLALGIVPMRMWSGDETCIENEGLSICKAHVAYDRSMTTQVESLIVPALTPENEKVYDVTGVGCSSFPNSDTSEVTIRVDDLIVGDGKFIFYTISSAFDYKASDYTDYFNSMAFINAEGDAINYEVLEYGNIRVVQLHPFEGLLTVELPTMMSQICSFDPNLEESLRFKVP